MNGVSSGNGSSSSSSDKSNCPKKTSNMEAELLQCICRPLVASGACRACLFRANKSRCWSRMGNNIICCILESHFSKMNFCYLSNSEEFALTDFHLAHGLLWKEKGINGTSARQYAGEFSEQNYQLMHHHRGSFQ
ncbi:hypothetical protein T12_10483 [Trichinella patagoniensis]|uniref:Uncharacterized protein n=1 Tax=Trichinella patagoniensis TaxID=990121 RepID=A0A0V0ZAS9_9BILA|nr:hypothetical protein T12_10483 [Trichinella patagoniensis]